MGEAVGIEGCPLTLKPSGGVNRVAGRRGLQNDTFPYYFMCTSGRFLKAAIFIDFGIGCRGVSSALADGKNGRGYEARNSPLPWPTGWEGRLARRPRDLQASAPPRLAIANVQMHLTYRRACRRHLHVYVVNCELFHTCIHIL